MTWKSDPGTVLTSADGVSPTLHSLIWLPLARIIETPVWGKVLGVVVALGQLLYADLSMKLIGLLMFSGLFDWFWGRKAAKAEGRFDEDISRHGLHSKIAGIAMLLIIRVAEGVAGTELGFAWEGFPTTALAIALLTQDLRSLQRHRQALGAGSWPLLDQVMGGIERAWAAAFGNRGKKDGDP